MCICLNLRFHTNWLYNLAGKLETYILTNMAIFKGPILSSGYLCEYFNFEFS